MDVNRNIETTSSSWHQVKKKYYYSQRLPSITKDKLLKAYMRESETA